MSGPDELDSIANDAIGRITAIFGAFGAAVVIVVMLALPAILS